MYLKYFSETDFLVAEQEQEQHMPDVNTVFILFGSSYLTVVIVGKKKF